MFVIVEMEKAKLKFIWDSKGPGIPKTILKKKNKTRGATLSNFKTFHKATVIRIVRFWPQDRHTDQRNRTESPETNLNIYSQLIFGKIAKIILWGKE